MALEVEVAEIEWDLSLRAQSRRALATNSVWLREERDGDWVEIMREFKVLIEKEGKKRGRGEIEDITAKEEISTLATRNRRVGEANQLISATAKRQADRSQ
ncbi:hypothetical protein J1N35_026230 [Gossypium stocksii]|uniref:Uncharacterized protein n=1 Tax=Gossypium stocksii TaxID=47602 RepID=A0A9D3V7M6_9ROSI|nr:hypothetical protein J1N35_026230 [Gossypium stocksii]